MITLIDSVCICCLIDELVTCLIILSSLLVLVKSTGLAGIDVNDKGQMTWTGQQCSHRGLIVQSPETWSEG